MAEIKISLRKVSDLFSAESFTISSYHVLLLKSTADLFGLFSIPDEVISLLSRDVLVDSVLMIYVWFATVCGMQKEDLGTVIECYRLSTHMKVEKNAPYNEEDCGPASGNPKLLLGFYLSLIHI